MGIQSASPKGLESKWLKRYRIMKLALYVVFIFIIALFSYKTLFPSKQFIFLFKTPQASKNNLLDPRRLNGEIYHSGKIAADGGLVFDAPLEELESDYSRIKVKLILDKSSSGTPQETKVKKSYRAFFYAEGSNVNDEEFEKLKNENNSEFFDSPLFSYGDAVYIIDGKTVRPFNSVETFLSLGYDWNDVESASGDEFMKYEKGKLFTAANPHPDGTIFVSRGSSYYYVIENGVKRRIDDSQLVEKSIRRSPVMVDEVSLDVENKCTFEKSWSILNKVYNCKISIDNLKPLLGNDYQFKISTDRDYKIKEAQIVFDKSLGWNNLKKSLLDIRKRIIQSYVPES